MPYTTHVESGKGNSLIFVGGDRERPALGAVSVSEALMKSATVVVLFIIIFAALIAVRRRK